MGEKPQLRVISGGRPRNTEQRGVEREARFSRQPLGSKEEFSIPGQATLAPVRNTALTVAKPLGHLRGAAKPVDKLVGRRDQLPHGKLFNSRTVKMSSPQSREKTSRDVKRKIEGMGARTPKAIGDRLEQLRHSLGINQTEFCLRAGIAPNAYTQYKKGNRLIDLDQAHKVCDAFQVTMEWIYRGNPNGLPVDVYQRLQEQRPAPARRHSA